MSEGLTQLTYREASFLKIDSIFTESRGIEYTAYENWYIMYPERAKQTSLHLSRAPIKHPLIYLLCFL